MINSCRSEIIKIDMYDAVKGMGPEYVQQI